MATIRSEGQPIIVNVGDKLLCERYGNGASQFVVTAAFVTNTTIVDHRGDKWSRRKCRLIPDDSSPFGGIRMLRVATKNDLKELEIEKEARALYRAVETKLAKLQKGLGQIPTSKMKELCDTLEPWVVMARPVVR